MWLNFDHFYEFLFKNKQKMFWNYCAKGILTVGVADLPPLRFKKRYLKTKKFKTKDFGG